MVRSHQSLLGKSTTDFGALGPKRLQVELCKDTPDTSMDGSGSCSDAEEISALQLSSQQAMCEWRLGTLGLAGLGCTCCTMRIFQIPGCVDPELQMVHSSIHGFGLCLPSSVIIQTHLAKHAFSSDFFHRPLKYVEIC